MQKGALATAALPADVPLSQYSMLYDIAHRRQLHVCPRVLVQHGIASDAGWAALLSIPALLS